MQGDEGPQQYKPSDAVLARLAQADFVAVVGPTAAGKDTLIAACTKLDSRIHKVVGDTSRPPRAGERDGTDMHFRSLTAMQARIVQQSYAQVVLHPGGDMYATAGDEYSLEGFSLMPVLASAVPVFQALPFKRMRILYVLPPDYDTWMQRIVLHGFTPEQVAKRLAEARDSLVFARSDPSVYFIISDGLQDAAVRAVAFLCDEVRDATEQAAAHVLIGTLLEKLNK